MTHLIKRFSIFVLLLACFFSYAPAIYADSEVTDKANAPLTQEKEEGELTPLPDWIDDMAPTTLTFSKEQYAPGETVEFTAEVERRGIYIGGSTQLMVDYKKTPLRYSMRSTNQSFIVKGKFTAPETDGTISIDFSLKMQDETGFIWTGLYLTRLQISSVKSLALSPSKATVKVGEEVLLVGKHSKGLDAETGWNVNGDTGYFELIKNVVRLDSDDEYSREVTSFIPGKPGVYTVYYGIDYKLQDGTPQHEYLSATITVE